MTTHVPVRRALEAGARWERGQVREALLLALTLATGSVDAMSWLVLGNVFSAFVTGNLLFVGLLAGRSTGPELVNVAASLAAFALGTGIGSWVMRSAGRQEGSWPFQVSLALSSTILLEVGALGLWKSCGGHPSGLAIPVLIGMLALAIRIQAAAVAFLRVTGVLAMLATAALGTLMDDAMGWPPLRGQATRLATVTCALLAGAAVGGLLVDRARLWAPLFPLCVTLLVCVVGHVGLRDELPGSRSDAPTR